MDWFIDGYNVTKTDPATRDLSLEEQRSALESRMRANARKVLGTTSYTIVWDGAGGEGIVSPTSTKESFTRMKTADDSIVKRVRTCKSRVGLVTSDRELQRRAKSASLYGVDVKPSSTLFASAMDASKPSKKGKKTHMSRDIGIPANANEINRELKELWGIED